MNNQALFSSFEAEIEEVQSTLLVATTDLTNPLGDLVRGHIKRSQPPICGAVVLAVANTPGSAPEDGDRRRKRIVLAAALEMLHIALNVHRLLVNAAINEQKRGADDAPDRAFIGSTILAGDYCFSRAAQLAAQTDHPLVVATFSLALQTVSEELLREQFHPSANQNSYDETRQLLQSGAHAAAQLVGLNAADEQIAIALSQELATYWARHSHDGDNSGSNSSVNHDGNRQLPPFSAATAPPGWQALRHWLNAQATNHRASPPQNSAIANGHE